MSHTDVLFRDLHADDLSEVTEIESLCCNCYENGVTKLLLTKIPFFRDVIIASFSCDHCGFHNNSIDSAGKCQNKGVNITLRVNNKADLNRRMVMSKTSILNVPALDSSFPMCEGTLTTVEGSLMQIIEKINLLQEERREVSPELAEQLDVFLNKLKALMEGGEEFTIELTDPSGNSVIENLLSPKADPQISMEHYIRSPDENEALGLDRNDMYDPSQLKTFIDEANEEFKHNEEVLLMDVNCPNCNLPIQCRMKALNIPHFKEVIVMASSCDSCGHRENQVIGGCGIAEKGQCITLQIEKPEDLARDFLKAETASLNIPEFEIETVPGSLGGRFTTVEGILRLIADKMETDNPFLRGDSATKTTSETILRDLIEKIRQVADGIVFGVTFIVKDPAGNSYIQDLYTPDFDPRLTVEAYERSFEENEDMGLNDINTETFIS